MSSKKECYNGKTKKECYKVLSNDHIVSRIACGLEKTRNLQKCPKSDEENFCNLSHSNHRDTLLHTESLLITCYKKIKTRLLKKKMLKIEKKD